MKTEKAHIEHLRSIGACPSAIEFAREYNSMEETWDACDKPDWLMWYAGRVSGNIGSPERRKLVFVCAQLARLALPKFEDRYPNDKRGRACIEACEQYSRGEITVKQLQEARAAASYAANAAAYAAADAAYAANDAYAAAEAAYAADAADAAYAANDAYAAAEAAYAADAAANAAASDTLAVIREHYPTCPIYIEEVK